MNAKDFLKITLMDIKVDLSDEFDRNFERKGFFNKKWKKSELRNRKGSVMMRTGALRRSINSRVKSNVISFTSSLEYASIHNTGGEFKVTQKMKSFFWAMYYKAGGGAKNAKGQRKEKLTVEVAQWKAMALKKVGSKITIEQRQFIGHHPRVDASIKEIINHNIKEVTKTLGK